MSAIPEDKPKSVVEWANRNVRLKGSARSEQFNGSITPWTSEAIERAADPRTRVVTFVGPVQSGKSTVGEVALCYWLTFEPSGDIQYNWKDDDKAELRQQKRIEPILLGTKSTAALWPLDRGDAKSGLIKFPSRSLIIQGVFSEGRLDSDSIRYQINEEIHSWEPGRLSKAFRRTTAYTASQIFNISNAGNKGDQLHVEFQAGTMQEWEVKCPGCGQFHDMRTKWDDKRPDLGGLRYDSTGCKRPDGSYDYPKLESTIRYQMPCGYIVRDGPRERRLLSISGRMSEPRNTGAPLSKRSYHMDAVAVDYIPWVSLIKEKHEALKALNSGNIVPFTNYIQERETLFFDPEQTPRAGKIVVNTALRKTRDGLPNRAARFAALDRQRGVIEQGELPHWWLLIRDFDAVGNSRLVFEGKVETDEEVKEIISSHEVLPSCVVADSGHDARNVYQFCLRNGYSAIKGSGASSFLHKSDGGKRIFSEETPIHLLINAPPTRDDAADEPLFWHYSKTGIRDRLNFLRSSKTLKWEVPGDVSEDYHKHMASEELQFISSGKSGEKIATWVQVSDRNDLFVCECYVSMLAEMAELIAYDERTTSDGQRAGGETEEE